MDAVKSRLRNFDPSGVTSTDANDDADTKEDMLQSIRRVVHDLSQCYENVGDQASQLKVLNTLAHCVDPVLIRKLS